MYVCVACVICMYVCVCSMCDVYVCVCVCSMCDVYVCVCCGADQEDKAMIGSLEMVKIVKILSGRDPHLFFQRLETLAR